MNTRSIGNVSVFGYPFGLLRGGFHTVFILPFILGTVVMLAPGIGLVFLFIQTGFDAIGLGQVFLFCFACLWSFLIISRLAVDFLGALNHATIVLDEKGVSTRIAGLRVRKISWRDIEKISKHRSLNRQRTFSDTFRIESKAQRSPKWFLVNLFGNILFTGDLEGYQGLVEQINARAKRHGIPLFFFNEDEDMAVMSGSTRRKLAKLRKKNGFNGDVVESF